MFAWRKVRQCSYNCLAGSCHMKRGTVLGEEGRGIICSPMGNIMPEYHAGVQILIIQASCPLPSLLTSEQTLLPCQEFQYISDTSSQS